MKVKEFEQIRYEGKELQLIHHAFFSFREAEWAWEKHYPDNPMTIREMYIERFNQEEETAVCLDVEVVGLKDNILVIVEERYYADTILFPKATYMMGHEDGEYEVEFSDLVEELETKLFE